MSEAVNHTVKYAAIDRTLGTTVLIEELNARRDIVKTWTLCSFSTRAEAVAVRHLLADILGKQEFGPPLNEMSVMRYQYAF